MTLLSFVIPVRHQDNARDWPHLKANLSQTIASISNQTHDDWRAIIVANEGADLPRLREPFSVVWVDFPPNDLHEVGMADIETVRDAFRADKGRRVLSGMLQARDSKYFMIVDDDDFVSRSIVEFVSKNTSASGWKVDRGYIWDEGGRFLLAWNDFNHLCGTSLIIRTDLYELPERFEDASMEWVKSMLGSHVQVVDKLVDRGTPLAPLPFRGAVYRVGHRGSHSKTPNLWVAYVLPRMSLLRPRRTLRTLANLRLLGKSTRREFFGLSSHDASRAT